MWGYSFDQLFWLGGGVMWPLLGLSILGLALAVEKAIVIAWRSTSYANLVAGIGQWHRDRRQELPRLLAEHRSPLAAIAAAFFQHATADPAARRRLVEQEASLQIARIERRLSWLAMIGGLATLLGLLGTVIGLVDAFHQVEQLGGQVRPEHLAAGIWKALLTTVFGLIVAIPCTAAHHLLEDRVGIIALQAEWLIVELEKLTAAMDSAQEAGRSRHGGIS